MGDKYRVVSTQNPAPDNWYELDKADFMKRHNDIAGWNRLVKTLKLNHAYGLIKLVSLD